MSHHPRFKAGDIVFCQGRWKCRVVAQQEDRLTYIALEGYSPQYRGVPLTADVALFTTRDETSQRSDP